MERLGAWIRIKSARGKEKRVGEGIKSGRGEGIKSGRGKHKKGCGAKFAKPT